MQELYRTKNSSIPYRIVRTRRRTMGLEVDLEGRVVARIPKSVAIAEAKEFVEEKQDWILKSQERMKDRRERTEAVDWEGLYKETKPWINGEGGEMFRQKVSRWAEKMDVSYNTIRIKDMTSRWGSCSYKKNLNFCWRVFAMPERLVDYLIVHELAHLKRMDHSPEFWAVVRQYVPDYKVLKKELNGLA